jgi:hypothetical protein
MCTKKVRYTGGCICAGSRKKVLVMLNWCNGRIDRHRYQYIKRKAERELDSDGIS